MRIFLAGHPVADDWREQFGVCERHASESIWPGTPASGGFTYTGPYFGRGGTIIDLKSYVQSCKGAIQASELVYAWAAEGVLDGESLWALGYANAHSIRTGVGAATNGLVNVMRCFADQCVIATTPVEGLQGILRGPAPDRFFRLPWRKVKAKFDNAKCSKCQESMTVGEDIMWLKGDASAGERSQVCHMDCFFQDAPLRGLPPGLQQASLEVLVRRAERLEEEKERLLETIQDLSKG